ncbi:MAG: sigma-70 family RNA polymerase sigma factor, partial [Desulfobulbaceae bacterium]|nr:sigma-70 family RNA polymerase sigma factor [Desulfobulbaceae bacterium]
MVSQNSYDGIDKYAADLIRHKARQLVGKAGFTEHDRPDLEQELMIDLLQRMRHFNPAKAKKTTFMARIVERHISTILEARF